MAYSSLLADKIREYLSKIQNLKIEEKEMFGGLAFMINDKMCLNVGDDLLMCRFDPELTEELSDKTGFLPMIMKGKEFRGYCYVEPIGYKNNKDFEFWINLCLDFNSRAKSSKKQNRK